MKVHVIKWMSIEEFVKEHPRSRVSFDTFKTSIKYADWETTNDILRTFASSDIINNNRIVFNIGGNNFRLICSYWFGPKMVHLYVKWIGTHSEYSKLCRQNLQYTIDLFK